MKCPQCQFENPDDENLLLIYPQGRAADSPKNNFRNTILTARGSVEGVRKLATVFFAKPDPVRRMEELHDCPPRAF